MERKREREQWMIPVVHLVVKKKKLFYWKNLISLFFHRTTQLTHSHLNNHSSPSLSQLQKLRRSSHAAQSLSFPLPFFSSLYFFVLRSKIVGWFKSGFRLDPWLTKAPLVLAFCLGHLASTESSIDWVAMVAWPWVLVAYGLRVAG